MDEKLMEVYFGLYCMSCKHKELNENKDPCEECLSTPCRPNTKKPLKYESNK